MYRLVVPKKNIGDASVTGFYMNIIKEACEYNKEVCKICDLNFSGNKKEDTIIVDDILQAFKFFFKGYKKIFLWVQGVIPEESYMRNQSKLRFFILSQIEKYVLKKCKLIFMCSEEMREHYKRKYKLCLKNNTFIMPCFNEENINESAFDSLDKYKENNFLYVGSIKKWQCFDEIVKIYKKLEEITDKKIKLNVFTGQQEEAKKIIEKMRIKNYSISYASSDELSEKIRNMKYGFVIREDSIVNNVATPTKFSNYISNGIIPIYSSSLVDFYTQDLMYKTGIVFDLKNEDEGIKRVMKNMELEINNNEMKKKCEMWYLEYYNKNKYIVNIAKKIKELKD